MYHEIHQSFFPLQPSNVWQLCDLKMSPALSHLSVDIQIPEISQAEIDAFHQEHFSAAAIALFTADFLQPPQNCEEYASYEEYYEEGEGEEEDDGLGYYPDGVKRTLTDEQIAIFRHSELESLCRAKEEATTKGNKKPPTTSNVAGIAKASDSADMSNTSASEEGELESDTPKPKPAGSKKKKKKKKKKKSKQNSAAGREYPEREPGWFRKNVKPDLRKRTYDVVEAGLDSLDYDGLDSAAPTDVGHTAQRRKISYDDD